MTKEEAIIAMKSGKWVRHYSFTSEEKITMIGYKIIDEDGYESDLNEFWKYRDIPAFKDGWEVIKE